MKQLSRVGASAARVGLVLLDRGEPSGVPRDAQLVEQVFFAVDVVVEAALQDAHARRDVLDASPVVALLEEDLTGRVEDLVPPLDVERALRDRGAGYRFGILREQPVLPLFWASGLRQR